MPSIIIGEGWGCAGFDSELGRIRQCWDAGPTPRAWGVPWLKDRMIVAPDRICEHDVLGLTFRCWHRPRRGDLEPRELPASWEWLNPHHARWDEAQSRGDRLDSVFVGGTFACLRTTKDQGVFCLGDDRFGQLGASSPPRPDAGAGDPAFVRGLGQEVAPAVGTWHACALETPRGISEEIAVLCWGRADHGQLGAPAPDTCVVDRRRVPCARTPVRGPRVADQMAVLGAGDLFTCITTESGIKCWGANRDGFFGVRGSCPEALKRAWPTPGGPVAAPNAACTTAPVAIEGATEFDPNFTVRPRQLCFTSGGPYRCLGGVPRPRDPGLLHYQVSPGSDASACAVSGEGVVCWGEKYSPPAALDEPVSIAFEPLPPLGDMAVVGDLDASKWKPGCQIQRVCPAPVKKLPPCQGREKVRSASEVLAAAPALAGQVLRVRGPLGVGEMAPNGTWSTIECNPDVSCCSFRTGPVVLGADNGTLALTGLHCSGDESRACCNVPAYGQTVVATGRLDRDSSTKGPSVMGWRLANVTVCEAAQGETERRAIAPPKSR